MSSSKKEHKEHKPTTFIITDKFVSTVWAGRDNDKLVSGQRVINELFSLESFVVTNKSEHQSSKLFAKKITPAIRNLITNTDKELRVNLATVENELKEVLNDPVYRSIDIGGGSHTYKQTITVPGNTAWPLVNQFIKTFLIIDVITEKLREMYKMGVITFSEYKNKQRILLKPIWKCMTQIDETVRKFHEHRKKLK